MRHVSFIDATGLRNLHETIKILRSKDVKVILSGVNTEVRKDISSIIDTDLDEKYICDSFKAALEQATAHLQVAG